MPNEIKATIVKNQINVTLEGDLSLADPAGSPGGVQWNKNGLFGSFGSYDEENDELTLNSLKLTGAITEDAQAITLGFFNQGVAGFLPSSSPAGGILSQDIENWDDAFSWGDHAGLYDTIGTASGLLSGHTSAYNHSLIATALQSETDPIYSAWDKSTGITITESQISDLKTYIQSSEKGANNGVSTLDSGGKIPASQLPATVMEFKGTWNATTNSPALSDGMVGADNGDIYLCNVAGTINLGSGAISFAVGDWAVYNGSIWQKSINSNSVVSVNGQQGVVSLNTDNISEGVTNQYYTVARTASSFLALSQATPQTVGNTTDRLSKLWATDIDTNGLTVDTNTLLIDPANHIVNVGGGSVLSLGANGTAKMLVQDNVNAVSGLQMSNVNAGTVADFRFLIKDTTGHYFAFSQPGVGNTQSAIFGLARANADLIFSSGGTARSMGIGTFTSDDLVLGTNNTARITVKGAGGIIIGTGSLTSGALLDVNGKIYADDGTATSPGFSFRGDTNTGFSSTGDNVRVVAGGVLSMSISQNSVTLNGTMRLKDGSAGAPALTFNLDADNGLYRSADNTWHAVSNGATVMTFAPGVVNLPTLTASRLVATDGSDNLVSVAPAGTYTQTNVSVDRAYDDNATTLDELADVLGILIADLKTINILA